MWNIKTKSGVHKPFVTFETKEAIFKAKLKLRKLLRLLLHWDNWLDNPREKATGIYSAEGEGLAPVGWKTRGFIVICQTWINWRCKNDDVPWNQYLNWVYEFWCQGEIWISFLIPVFWYFVELLWRLTLKNTGNRNLYHTCNFSLVHTDLQSHREQAGDEYFRWGTSARSVALPLIQLWYDSHCSSCGNPSVAVTFVVQSWLLPLNMSIH